MCVTFVVGKSAFPENMSAVRRGWSDWQYIVYFWSYLMWGLNAAILAVCNRVWRILDVSAQYRTQKAAVDAARKLALCPQSGIPNRTPMPTLPPAVLCEHPAQNENLGSGQESIPQIVYCNHVREGMEAALSGFVANVWTDGHNRPVVIEPPQKYIVRIHWPMSGGWTQVESVHVWEIMEAMDMEVCHG